MSVVAGAVLHRIEPAPLTAAVRVESPFAFVPHRGDAGPYRVTDLRYYGRGFWQSLDNPALTARFLVINGLHFYAHVGRLIAPILIWMVLCRGAVISYAQLRTWPRRGWGARILDRTPSGAAGWHLSLLLPPQRRRNRGCFICVFGLSWNRTAPF